MLRGSSGTPAERAVSTTLGTCGRGNLVPKLTVRVRFSSPAQRVKAPRRACRGAFARAQEPGENREEGDAGRPTGLVTRSHGGPRHRPVSACAARSASLVGAPRPLVCRWRMPHRDGDRRPSALHQLQSVFGERFFDDPQCLRAHPMEVGQLLAGTSATSRSVVNPALCRARVAGAPILGNSSNGVGISRRYRDPAGPSRGAAGPRSGTLWRSRWAPGRRD